MSDSELMSTNAWATEMNNDDFERLQHIAWEMYQRLRETEEIRMDENGDLYWLGSGDFI